MTAFDILTRARQARAANQPARVFDWHKAAQFIRERQPALAEAGLAEDWTWTGGAIWQDGAPVPQDETYVYLASLWATPVLRLDGEQIECWRVEGDVAGWDEHTYWPGDTASIARGGTGEAG